MLSYKRYKRQMTYRQDKELRFKRLYWALSERAKAHKWWKLKPDAEYRGCKDARLKVLMPLVPWKISMMKAKVFMKYPKKGLKTREGYMQFYSLERNWIPCPEEEAIPFAALFEL